MQNYKRLLIATLPFSVIITTLITVAVPIYDNRALTYYFHGLFENASQIWIIVLVIIGFNCNLIISDLLLVMLIDRYYSVTSVLYSKSSECKSKLIYTFLLLTGLLQCLMFTILFSYKNLPWGLDVTFQSIELFHLQAVLVFQLSRVIGLVGILILNFRLGKDLKAKASPNVVLLHKMLTRAINATVLFMLLVTRVPLILAWLAKATPYDVLIDIVATMATCLQQTAFLGDMLITFYLVKPYKSYITQLFVGDKTVTTVMVY
uniref:Serpentine receptor class gamma n=1 Tax=Panagrellus redivivus TaxID=6233 RepID=A0A7E4W7W6_PANRE